MLRQSDDRAMPADSAALASDIAAELGWERSAVDPIVEAICAAKTDNELQELIQVVLQALSELLWHLKLSF